LEGPALLIDGQKHRALGPGDIAHGPVRGSSVLRFTDAFKILFMRLPSAALNTRFTHAPQATCLNTQTAIGRILAAILGAVAETIEDVPDGHERVIESLLREFIVVNLMHSHQRLLRGWTGRRAGRIATKGLSDHRCQA